MDVLDHYCCNKDLPFKLKFDDDYKVDATDEVVILKLGWSNKSEAIVKKPVEKVSEEGICCMSFKSKFTHKLQQKGCQGFFFWFV